MTLFITSLLAIIICLLITLCWTDLRYRLISNRIIMALLLVTIPFSYLVHGTLFWLPTLLCLAIGFILFLFNIIGAGDVQVLAVLMLASPSHFAVFFPFFNRLCGFVAHYYRLVVLSTVHSGKRITLWYRNQCWLSYHLTTF